MPRSSTPTTSAALLTDQLQITALGVGHGDAVLIRWNNDGRTWTCLVDGGKSPTKLMERLTSEKVKHIDLLVLTHLDTDHSGGLKGLAKKVPIKRYWGPTLPAFERLRSLFGPGCGKAIERGRALEEELRAAHALILYPLEGHQSAPLDNNGKVSVLSPAPRLIQRLLTGENVHELFVQDSALGWLLDPPPEQEEQSVQYPRLNAALVKGSLDPEEDLKGLPIRPVTAPEDWAQTMKERCTALSIDPEFFGDWVMNNTSLVLYLELPTGNRTHTVLLPGDQEDWTYLLARNPRGLRADVLKASHHGGRVYLGNELAHDELFSSIRPAIVLISGNGEHGLPRDAIRRSALQWGASVACTCSRKKEFFTTTPPEEENCCRVIHDCETGINATLFLDRDGIWSDRPACGNGHGNQPGPAILIRQHVVDPSPILQNLAEQELQEHLKWTKEKLKEIHQNRLMKRQGEFGSSDPVPLEMLEDMARQGGRSHCIPYLQEVLRQGMKRGAFWAAITPHNRTVTHAYACPTEDEVIKFKVLLRAKEVLMFTKVKDLEKLDRETLIHSLNTVGLGMFAEASLLLPAEAFRETLWPHIAKELNGPHWHCYFRVDHGDLAFSARRNVKTLVRSVLEALRGDSKWNDEAGDWLFRGIAFPYSAPVWLDDLTYYHYSPHQYCDHLKRWFFPDYFYGDLRKCASQVEHRIRQSW